MRSTLKDAQQLEVSSATVSRVLNGKTGVSEEFRSVFLQWRTNSAFPELDGSRDPEEAVA